MVEQLQCPVCTLFLHAGMNLSDHLETHPKEQVIKALVQLTVARVAIEEVKNDPVDDMPEEKKSDVDPLSTKTSIPTDKDPELCTNSINDSSSSLPSTFSSNTSLNLPFGSQQLKKETATGSSSAALISLGKHIFNHQNVTSSPAYQHSVGAINLSAGMSDTKAGDNNDASQMPTDFSTFPNRYHQQHASSQLNGQQHQQHPQQQVTVLNQRSSPPPQEMAHHIGQLNPTGASNGYQSKSHKQPPIQLLSPANHLHSQQLQQRQLHQLPLTQQPENMKIFYSSALPPPPPQLQIFNYQQTTQPQHQKPPPAYGTAISQIRSQHNQNKQTLQQQQQQLQQHMQRSLTSPALFEAPLSSSKQLYAKKSSSSLPSPVVNHHKQYVQQQQHNQQPLQQHETVHTNQQHIIKNVASPSSSSSFQKSGLCPQRLAPQHPPSSSPELPTQTAIAAPMPNRLTHSPYPSILSVAMASPSSCSSVLRYAESPVTAHYLERDNGDFIVQETPKHIVECVEKDNGEFSVIERIYQSPPSVLRIHDDDEDDDDGVNHDADVADVADDKDKVKESIIEEGNKDAVTAKEKPATEIENDEEFMSIDGESDMDESTTERSLPEVSERLKDVLNHNACVDKPSTSAAAAAASATTQEENTINSSAGSSSLMNAPTNQSTTRKKTSKNTITVLSDVQLNLNEYLDLVGNIIASSKIAKNHAFAAAQCGSMPMPLLKVEKIEPIDDYEANELQQQEQQLQEQQLQEQQLQEQQIQEHQQQEQQQQEQKQEQQGQQHSDEFDDKINIAEMSIGVLETVETSSREPPITTSTITNNNKDNITETDDLVANNYSYKPNTPEKPTQKNGTTDMDSMLRIQQQQQYVANAAFAYTSHATTSVIRMATTASSQKRFHDEKEQQKQEQHLQQPQQQPQQQQQPQKTHKVPCVDLSVKETKNILESERLKYVVPEDLSSQTQIKVETVSTEAVAAPALILPPPKKGPKKLVIKPRSNATTVSCNKIEDLMQSNDEQPTSFAGVKKSDVESETFKQETISKNVVIKSEPNVSFETTTSILEKHLKGSSQPLELKQELSSSQYDKMLEVKREIQPQPQQFNIKNEGDEINTVPNTTHQKIEDEPQMDSSPSQVNEDARNLLDFANTNKKESLDSASSSAKVTFPSSNSIFGVASVEKSIFNNFACSTSLSSSSVTTSAASSNPLGTLRCDDEFIVPDATDVQEIVISSCYSSQSASDVALNNCNNETNHQQHNNFSDYPFSFLYGGGSVAQEIATKGSFSPIYHQQPHDATTAATLASGSNSVTIGELIADQHQRNQLTNRYNHHTASTAATRQWYHAVSTSNTDFEAALAIDCGGCTEGSDAGNYLDLDSYKRVNMAGSALAVAAALSSSLSSFTAATESSLAGCTTDALNIRTDEKMPAKGEISEQESNCDIENSWSQSMYGDIPVRFFKSSFPNLFPPDNCWNNEEYFTVQDLSASAGATNVSNRATKSFDFRLPLEAAAASSSSAAASTANNSAQPHTSNKNKPSISTSSKKKRKRDLNAAKGSTATATTSTTRTIAATVTSHDLQLQQQQQQEQLHSFHHESPTTSAAVLAGPSTTAAAGVNVAAVTAGTSHRRAGKVYTCVHCLTKFTKLKDRNLHMIANHNYVLRNHRLVPMQKVTPTAAAVSAITSAVKTTSTSADLPATSSGLSMLAMEQQLLEMQEDSKHGIVKIELDQAEQAVVARLAANNTTETTAQILAKSEFVDNSDALALVSASVVADAESSGEPVFLPSLTRLYNLYHMLVSFNIAALKQNQTLSDADEKLMLSSIFFCFICKQKFGTVKLYDAHMTEHPGECYTCGKKFHRWSNLSLHLKRHLGWKEFGCSVCDKKFVVRSALVEHMRMHTGLKPLKCNVCDKHFKRFSNLAQHRKRHGKQIIRKKEFVCFCGEVLPSKARFMWHKETHDAKPKCCPYCCDRFVHANSLRRHIRLAHSDKFDYTEPMECPMCKQVFAKSSIRAHMATHSMEMQHVCPICSKSFSTKWNLKIHSWVHANRTSKPYKCEHCPKAFVREVDFKNHMNAHKQIKPYTCEYCGCKFIRKYNYLRHRREHHGNKKFTCDLCKKSFHRQYYLVEHRRIHTGERPFQCTICGKSSTTKTNHNKHLKIHHSRDPFTVEA